MQISESHKKSKQYFEVQREIDNQQEESNLVKGFKGQCQAFISEHQENSRGNEEFEKYPFQPISKYFRNKIYDQAGHLRTPQALDKSLQYLKQNFMVSLLSDKKKIKKIVLHRSQFNDKLRIDDQNIKAKKLERIYSIIDKEFSLGFLQQSCFETFGIKKTINNAVNFQKSQIAAYLIQDDKAIKFKEIILPQKILVFLETRLQAIRCELYVQDIVFPRLTLQLLKCQIFLFTLKENEYSNLGQDIHSCNKLRLIGLNRILNQQIKEIMTKPEFNQYYEEALTIAILMYQIKDITQLIDNHPTILTTHYLFQLLQLRLSIQRGNYYQYFSFLKNSNDILTICLLLTHLEKIRQRLCNVLKKTKTDVKKGWLAVLLGLKIKNEEEEELINLSKHPDYIDQKIEFNQVEQRQKQLKQWLKLEDLFSQLILNQK